MRVALIQMPVTDDKALNIKTACDGIREAAATGIDFAVLPEMFCSPYLNRCFRAFGEEAGGPAQTALSALAAELGIYIVGGSIPELADGNVYNTSYVYDRKGNQIAKHRKVHLFDIDVVGGQRYFESDTLTRGDSITTFETEFGTMGLCICFDMRFEELARCMCLRGSKVIFVPAAFNMTTGPAHWDPVPSARRGQPVLHSGLRSCPRSRWRVCVLGQLHRCGALGQRGGSCRCRGYHSVR